MGKVVVFSITGCPHCRAAKAVLKRHGAPFHNVNLDDYPSRRKEVVLASGGKKTVPQVFFNATHIGGSTELQALAERGQLSAMLSALADEPDAPGRPLTTEEYGAKHGSDEVKAEELPEVDVEATAVLDVAQELRRHLDIRDRRYRWSSYAKCFIGSEAVDWLVSSQGCSRAAAVDQMKLLVKRRVCHHVTKEHDFQDAPLFYRFQADEYPNVLNMLRAFDGTARSASAVANSLRRHILAIYSKFLSADGTAVDYASIAKSPEFQEYSRQTVELQGVDLTGLSRDETLALFINVYNALVIHGHVELGKPQGTWARLKFFSNVAYNIGGLTFSLNDIEQGVLRGNKVGPGELRKRFRSTSDPRLRFVMSPMDPRIHFALVCGAKSCPPIKVYAPENVQEALTLAAEAFVEDDHNFRIDEAGRTVTVSRIFSWYKKDFGKDTIDACHWAMQYLPPGKKAAMQRLLNLVGEASSSWGWNCISPAVSLKYFEYNWGSNTGSSAAFAKAKPTAKVPGESGARAGSDSGSGARPQPKAQSNKL